MLRPRRFAPYLLLGLGLLTLTAAPARAEGAAAPGNQHSAAAQPDAGQPDAGQPDAGQPVALRYAVWVGGAHMADVDLTLDRDPALLRLTMSGRTAGMAAVFSTWQSVVEAEARIVGGALRPVRYLSDRRWGRDKQMRTEITWDAQGIPTATRSPKPVAEKDRLPATVTRGAMDMATAILAGLMEVARDGQCAGRQPIFDGRYRYDALLRDRGPATLGRDPLGSYHGPARRCALDLELVAGFDEDDDEEWWQRYRPDAPPRPETLVWLVPLAQLAKAGTGPTPMMVPVRVQAESSLGGVVIHLQDVAAGG